MATVLVVDDLASHRQLTGVLLSRIPGWKAVYAANGKEALDKLAEQPIDVVLTDMLMPEMNGLELLREVRRSYPHVPVILMTASGSEYIAVQALQEGATSYVPKRGLSKRLADTLHSVLEAARTDRAHMELNKRLMHQELAFEIENEPPLVLALPSYMRPHLQAGGLGDHMVRVRTHMALEEALVNALYHGNLELGTELRDQNPDSFATLAARRARQDPYQKRRIHVRARFTQEKAQFSIRDEGPGFNPTTLPDPTDPANLDCPHGRGVLLMRTFMDEVRYNEVGNEVIMTKRVKPEAAAAPA